MGASGHGSKKYSAILLFLVCFLALPNSVLAQRELTRGEAHWESVSNVQGMDHRILTCMEFDGALIVGGEFNGAQGLVLNHIASWDGSQWSSLGNGLNFSVRCLGTYQGQLIAGGDFTASGGREMSHIAKWNGQEWEAMGEGFDGSPTCLMEWNGRLIAGGVLNSTYQHNGPDLFSYTASWDGTRWTPMGSDVDFTALSAPPRDLIVYRGSLYAAGSFTNASSFSQPIARWMGAKWVPQGPHMLPDPFAGGKPKATCFALLDSLLVVGGDFRKLDSLVANGIVAFDGNSWVPLGQGFPVGIFDLAVSQGQLFAAGIKVTQSGECVASWDGVTWKGMNIGTSVRALAVHHGLLYGAGGDETGEIQRWNGSQWEWIVEPWYPHLSKFRDPVQCLVAYNGQVVLPTWDWPPRDVEAIIHYDSKGMGLHDYHGVYPDWDYYDAHPTTIFRDQIISGLNTWNGQSAGRLPNIESGSVTALTSFSDELIAATRPTYLGAVLWAWNGSSWRPFADGLRNHNNPELDWGYWGVVRSLETYKNHLIAGGYFNFAEDAGHHLAVWNGGAWDSLAACPNDMVTSLITYHNDLIAAGFFDHIGSIDAAHIARWDGAQWHPLELGIDGPVYTLAIHNDRVIAGGFFKHAGGHDAGSIAAWDGKGWLPLTTGVDGEVFTMASNQGALWVGGEFSKAGGETSFHLAKWVEGPRAATFSNFTAQRTSGGVNIQVTADYIPFDHHGFLVYRRAQGEPDILLTSTPIKSEELAFTDVSPPLGPLTYVVSGISSTGAVTQYASTEVAADPALRFALLPIRPNPFQANAIITFQNATTGLMRVAVFDLRGRLVSELLNETMPPGAHSVTWNGRDASGRSVAAGTYFCRVTGPEGTRVERLVRSSQ